MNRILVIAWREVTRLRKRFGGGASPLAVIALLVILGLSAYYLRSTVSLGSGLYRIGVFGDVPAISDSRFSVMDVDVEQGQALLEQKSIDVFINGSQVFAREDDKSQFAVRALKQYMEKQELIRVGNSFAGADAFPLRVAINYFGEDQAVEQAEAGAPHPSQSVRSQYRPFGPQRGSRQSREYHFAWAARAGRKAQRRGNARPDWSRYGWRAELGAGPGCHGWVHRGRLRYG